MKLTSLLVLTIAVLAAPLAARAGTNGFLVPPYRGQPDSQAGYWETFSTAVGGAGNFAKTQPEGRQITLPKDIPCVIAAAGIGKNGEVPAFSSRGPCTWHDVPFFHDFPPSAPLTKPDVCGCSAGFPVWHWTQSRGRTVDVQWQDGQGFGLIVGPQGNSFAGPHAGGVAALVLSVRPELTPWRVHRLLAATCKDLGAAGADVVTGTGLLRADAAVAAAQAATIE